MIRQALHIFLKDSRQYRYTIAALMVWTLLLAASWLMTPYLPNAAYPVTGMADVIFPIVWCFFVARIVHGESLAGTRQFWLTRPYLRSSLFAAKTMFIGAYLLLPLAVAQWVVLMTRGFPLGHSVAAVSWEMLLVVVVWVLPAMTIAALTTSLAQFIPAMVVVPVMLGVVDDANQWGRFAWIPYTLALAVGAGGAAAVVYLQFGHRRELLGRVLGLIAVLAAAACMAFVPWRAVFGVQSSLAAARGENVVATIRRPEPRIAAMPGRTGQVQMLFEFTGLPSGTPIACHTGELVVRRPDGGTWRSSRRRPTISARLTVAETGCPVWFDTGMAQNLEELVDVDVTVFMTVFGSAQTTTIDVGAAAVPVAGAGVCSAVPSVVTVRSERHNRVRASCENALREAPRMVQFKSSDRDVDFAEPRSYSPFPARLQVRPIERVGGSVLDATPRVDVVTRSPLAHVQRTVRLKGVRLADYELRLP